MTPEMMGRLENTNQKRRMELTLDLIEAVALDGQQRERIREILREQFSAVIEEERKGIMQMIDAEIEIWETYTNNELPIRELTAIKEKIRARSDSQQKVPYVKKGE